MIEIKPDVCGGEPCVAGTRLTVNHLFNCFTNLLWDVNRVLKEYPELKRQDVMDALKYARYNKWCLHDEPEEAPK